MIWIWTEVQERQEFEQKILSSFEGWGWWTKEENIKRRTFAASSSTCCESEPVIPDQQWFDFQLEQGTKLAWRFKEPSIFLPNSCIFLCFVYLLNQKLTIYSSSQSGICSYFGVSKSMIRKSVGSNPLACWWAITIYFLNFSVQSGWFEWEGSDTFVPVTFFLSLIEIISAEAWICLTMDSCACILYFVSFLCVCDSLSRFFIRMCFLQYLVGKYKIKIHVVIGAMFIEIKYSTCFL